MEPLGGQDKDITVTCLSNNVDKSMNLGKHFTKIWAIDKKKHYSINIPPTLCQWYGR